MLGGRNINWNWRHQVIYIYTHTYTHIQTYIHTHTWIKNLSSVRQQEEENKRKVEGQNIFYLTWTMVPQWKNKNYLKFTCSNWERSVLGNVLWPKFDWRSRNHCFIGKTINITWIVFVFVVLVFSMTHIIFRVLSGSTISFHII